MTLRELLKEKCISYKVVSDALGIHPNNMPRYDNLMKYLCLNNQTLKNHPLSLTSAFFLLLRANKEPSKTSLKNNLHHQ